MAPNYDVGKDENPRYERPLLSSKSHCYISKRQLTTSEESVLTKGLSIAPTIKRIPFLDLIALIEEAAIKIPNAWQMR